jgi:UDP-glucuronate decarboxylase
MKRVLITGGAGFIGSHLVDRLLSKGCEVISLDNYFTGTKDNLSEALDSKRFEALRHDVVEPMNIEVDEIYHLACPASPVHYQYDPVKTVETCVLGTINVLRLAHRTGAKVLLASTSEVYGDPEVHPQVESYWGNVNCVGPRSCYDEGKRVAETLTSDYRRKYNVDAKIIRIFNTYGPRMLFNDGRVVSNFIVQALKNEPITIYGTGMQTRSFCFVDDLVSAFIAVMEKDGFTGPVNLGNPSERTMLDLAEHIIRLTGSSSTLEFRPSPIDDPSRRKPDITVAKTQLGWEPKVSIEEGLEKTIADFRLRMEKGLS